MTSCTKHILFGLFLFILTASGGSASGFLRASGDRIVTESNEPVVLRGLNIEFKDFKIVLGEHDIQKIARRGANCIRLVIDYRDLESAPFRYRRENFLLLDRILDWCEKYRVFVVLDMHLAPGIQNLHDFVVHREKTALFWNSEVFKERFYSLWARIAKRYANRQIVAGYDLLNEGTPHDARQYKAVLNAAARAIRTHDRNHMLIVQEVILPDGQKEFVLIDDKNAVYSIHFFFPPQFSLYVTTKERTVTTYPGAMITAGTSLGETASETITGNSDWTMLTISGFVPDHAKILKVVLSSKKNTGAVWFDDVILTIDNQLVDLPAQLVHNNSFEVDYPGFDWISEGPCANVTTDTAKTGERALSFFRCLSMASVESSPIQVTGGTPYVLTAWYKSKDATGDTHLSLSWHDEKTIRIIDKASVLERIDYALRFRNIHKVPVYVGEFTAHANPSTESVSRYLNDLLEIFEAEGLHWTFWGYYSIYPGVGVFTGERPRLVNPTAWDMLRGHLSQQRVR